MNSPLDIKEILRLLPHRFPFLLVDRVVSYEADKTISAYKNVTYNEPFFQGHFPGRPVMPGVLIVEAIAQTGGLLYMLSQEEIVEGQLFYFLSADKVKFRNPVVPGDRLDFEVNVLRLGSRAWKFQGEAFVDGVKAAEAVILAGSKSD
ncbi:MAG: 3-hydroxyacyl-ACP dehydratase FabZ [Deltaproteobacteria bacterium]|nr:3-hydroxyacyl-ACP dehydratase FabZ [Deltaproteobacteria bacterium]